MFNQSLTINRTNVKICLDIYINIRLPRTTEFNKSKKLTTDREEKRRWFVRSNSEFIIDNFELGAKQHD